MTISDHTLLIGVDGGGTGCRASIGTLADGVLGQAEGGRANATSDPSLAIENVIATVEAAAGKANISHAALPGAVAHIGLAGIMSPEDAARISSALPFESTTVTDDRATAVAGALGDQDGHLLSIGTGTIVGASKKGALNFIGGWGFQLSDQGSGAWIGHMALRRTILCHDGLSDHSDLTRTLMDRFSDDPNAIVTFAASAQPGDYAALAPVVVSAASEQDTWGLSIMREGADYLVKALAALDFRSGDTLCLTGGIAPHYASYLPNDILAGRAPSKGSALDGAFQLAALRAANLKGGSQ